MMRSIDTAWVMDYLVEDDSQIDQDVLFTDEAGNHELTVRTTASYKVIS